MEDKCPTCPKYGTGQYCDCGRSKMKSKSLSNVLLLISAAIGFGYLIYKSFIL